MIRKYGLWKLGVSSSYTGILEETANAGKENLWARVYQKKKEQSKAFSRSESITTPLLVLESAKKNSEEPRNSELYWSHIRYLVPTIKHSIQPMR